MKKSTLFIVTDGAHARILEQNSKAESLYQVQNLIHTHEATHEHGPDKPGRVFESGPTTMRHAYQPHTDWHTHQKEVFIQDIAHLMIKMHEEKKYSKIYLICPPTIMGIIRSSIDPYQKNRPLKEKLNIVEITKDLTSKTIEDIEKYISNY